MRGTVVHFYLSVTANPLVPATVNSHAPFLPACAELSTRRRDTMRPPLNSDHFLLMKQ